MLGKKCSDFDCANDIAHLFLVGDRFKSQVPDPRIISVTELTGLIVWLSRLQYPTTPITLRIGQGVTDEHIAQIKQSLHAHRLSDVITLSANTVFPRASALLTHKQFPCNILISEPRTLDEGGYTANLHIDERCDDIHDHLTGLHIPGMVIMEAARQMVLAVSEKFIVSAEHSGLIAYITHRQTVDFIDFIFPLDVTITASVVHLRRSGNINFQAGYQLHFSQSSKVCAHAEFKLSGFDRRVFQNRESHQADQAIAQAFLHNNGSSFGEHPSQPAIVS